MGGIVEHSGRLRKTNESETTVVNVDLVFTGNKDKEKRGRREELALR